MRIGVAGWAGGERHSCISRFAIASRCVAFLACHFLMHPGERVACLRVIEALSVDLGGFPVDCGMALRAVWAKPALVLVLVAGNTTRRESEPCVIQVLIR